MYLFGLSNDTDDIWIQLAKKDIELSINFFSKKGTSINFEKSEVEPILKLEKDLINEKIADIFMEQVEIANKLILKI